MNAEMQNIMKKLVDMQALAERPGTPDEAAAAMAAIQRMMVKHNITQAELIAAGEIQPGNTIHEAHSVGRNLQWRKIMMQALAKSNNCGIVFEASGAQFHIFGKDHNIAVSLGMFEYLVHAIERMADEGWEESREKEFGIGTARGWKHSFRVGAGVAVARRIEAQATESRVDAGKANALMVQDASDAARMMREMFGRTRSSAAKMGHQSASGARAGHEAGNRVNLDAQVKGGSSRKHTAIAG